MTDPELFYEKEALEREQQTQFNQDFIEDQLYELKQKALKKSWTKDDEVVHLMWYTYYATHWASENF